MSIKLLFESSSQFEIDYKQNRKPIWGCKKLLESKISLYQLK